MGQCHGTTQRGTRCKLAASEDKYCRIHSRREPEPRSRGCSSDSRGFIYIYKLAGPHPRADVAYSNSSKKTRLRPSALQKFLGLFRRPRSNLANQELIKVGYTSKDPTKRVAEWEHQCGHRLSLIMPQYNPGKYDIKKCGWPTSHAYLAEKRIHNYLRSQFGGGKASCSQCLRRGKGGVHREWFLVPKCELPQIFTYIDKTI